MTEPFSPPDPRAGSTPVVDPDALFLARLDTEGVMDPREIFRSLLRGLRDEDPEGYRVLVGQFEADVVTPIRAGSSDPLEAWFRFGLALADRVSPGEAVSIDGQGVAHPFIETEDGATAPVPAGGTLVLHLPEAPGIRAIPVQVPGSPTPSQQATMDLLVDGKVRNFTSLSAPGA